MNGMYYLFFQIWVWIAISFFLGWTLHWFLMCRNRHDDGAADATPLNLNDQTSPAPVASKTKVAEKEPTQINDNWKPQLFTQTPDSVDDIKRIKGIGAVIEKTLNELGVYQFEQIASWDQNNCAWVDNFLAFPGRINREDWVNQASLLARGESTEFAKRVDKGDVSYKK